MRAFINILLGCTLLSGFLACKKTDPTDCFKSTGQVIFEDRESVSVRFIRLENNVNLILTQDQNPQILVEAGENLLDKIDTELNGDSLFIRNNNSCNWVRSFSTLVNVYVNVTNLLQIEYFGSGNITVTNTIISDSLKLDIRKGAGSVNLMINSGTTYLNLHEGTCDITCNGNSSVTFIYAADYGPFFCEGLESHHVFINNRGTNDCYVRAVYELGATIEYLGNIYYYGNPSIVNSVIKGSGKLIKMD